MRSRRTRCLMMLVLSGFTLSACAMDEATEADNADVGSQVAAIQTTTLTYKGNNFDDCTVTRNIYVKAPDAAGTYPVLLYFAGSLENFNGLVPDYVTDQAALRGYVAASVGYNNGLADMATYVPKRIRCAMDTTYNAQSAVAAVCAHPKANCSRGIVVAGHSQGGAMAALAKNYNSNVRAAWSMGFSGANFANSVFAAAPYGTRVLPNDRLRITNGWFDPNNQDTTLLNQKTGRACAAGVANCLTTNGSGWYRVPLWEVSSGNPDKHCYFQNNFDSTDCGNLPAGWTINLDTHFKTGSADLAAIDANLTYLLQFTP